MVQAVKVQAVKIQANRETLEYELEIDEFKWKCLRAREENKITCVKHRIGYGLFDMTPEEQLFSEFFKHEKVFVKDMDDLTLQAHRETLRKIAFEARARLTAVDDEQKERKPKGPQGFRKSVNVDDVTSDAINTISEREKRLSKSEKTLAGLLKLGLDPEYAAKLMSAGVIKAQLDKKDDEKVKIVDVFKETLESKALQDKIDKIEVSSAEAKTQRELARKAFVNPFAK